MQLPVINLPRAVPIQRQRTPQKNIPQTSLEREALRRKLRAFVASQNPVPPLGMQELRRMAEAFVAAENIDPLYADYAGVLLNSEVWRDQLAQVPFDRRLLLLPKCLRIEDQCPAPFDEFGLLCKQCGLCSIQELQEAAERLGYAVLVAEGSALVMAIIETGKIEAIVGVSCLSVLEKAFPYMESAAIPGVAIPLLQDDCRDVTVDLEWVWEVIHLTSQDRTYRLDLDGLRHDVTAWFEPDSLNQIMGAPENETERMARGWLKQDGKRWRPFLAVAAWQALQENPDGVATEALKKIAVAVECFHKASLVHDDIEDNDLLRYGRATLHAEHGVPIAINLGDLLLGDGYRLIGECDVAANVRGEMLRVAAAGHRTLCLGQGAELNWTRHPQPLTTVEVLDIFRRKTAPAFEVALLLGASLVEADDAARAAISRYSEALGIAYQIRDDVDDMDGGDEPDDLMAMRPSLPLALLYERTRAKPTERHLVARAWQRQCDDSELEQVKRLFVEYDVKQRCQGLLESYKEQAVRELAQLQNASLKGLLRRVISKMFSIEVKGWCSESEARDAASRSVVA
jgi:geranylgeranyl diphosphate synthase type II